MEGLSVLQSLIIAVWVAAVMSRSFLGGATLTMRFSPLMTGLVVGWVMGDVKNAMITTAALQLIYMGVFSPGGSMPSEPAVAAAIAVPVALLSKLTPEASIAVAVPVGLLGSYAYQLRFFANTFIIKRVDKSIDKLDDRAISRTVILYPILAAFIIFVPLMFVALYWGAPVIADVVAKLQGTRILHVLDVVGGGLAAIGIATTVYVIGRKDYVPFFLLAYFLSVILKSLEVTMVTYAVLGTVLSLIFVQGKFSGSKPATEAAVTADFDDDDDDF